MSHTGVKTIYAVEGSYGGTDYKVLYCHYVHSCDRTTLYDADGEVASMSFHEWESGNDLQDAMQRLLSPFKSDWHGEMVDGVRSYNPYRPPWAYDEAEACFKHNVEKREYVKREDGLYYLPDITEGATEKELWDKWNLRSVKYEDRRVPYVKCPHLYVKVTEDDKWICADKNCGIEL